MNRSIARWAGQLALAACLVTGCASASFEHSPPAAADGANLGAADGANLGAADGSPLADGGTPPDGCAAADGALAADGTPLADGPPPIDPESLYTQHGTDPTWQTLLEENRIPIGYDSTEGVQGSTVNVVNELVELGPHADRPIVSDIDLHTVGNAHVPRADFYRWSRWYQEDGNTQVFRLFEGEHNVRSDTENFARSEAYGGGIWEAGGGWHEWVGRYTIVKPHACSLFQAQNSVNQWPVKIDLTGDGDIILNHRLHQDDVVIAENMTGKGFDLRVRDNGHDYEVYLDGELKGTGCFDRPEGATTFRWGINAGDAVPSDEIMIFVTGATVDP